MTEIVKSTYTEVREVVTGEFFMVGDRTTIYLAKFPIHTPRFVEGILNYWPKGNAWIRTRFDLDQGVYVAFEIQAQDLRLGDYIGLPNRHGGISEWAKVEGIQLSMGGVSVTLSPDASYTEAGLTEDRILKVIRK